MFSASAKTVNSLKSLDRARQCFVLVHGSWHDGSVWDDTILWLKRAGHKAYAPTLPGHGKTASRNVTFTDYVQSVIDYIEQNKLKNVVLAGHSFGGAVVAKASETLAGRVKRLVFCAPIVPQDGNAAADETPPGYADAFIELAAQSDDNSFSLGWEQWRESFIGDAGAATARRTFDRLVPEPLAPVLEKVDLKAFYNAGLPKSYIQFTEDIAFPPGEWAMFPRMYTRLGPCRLVSMPGSHEAMYTTPQAVAAALIKAARD